MVFRYIIILLRFVKTNINLLLITLLYYYDWVISNVIMQYVGQNCQAILRGAVENLKI